MAEVAVRFAIPSEPLRPFISTYWEMEVTGTGVVEDMLHPEWANIRITLDVPWEFGRSSQTLVPMVDGIIHGPTSHGTYVRGAASTAFGIGLLPTGWNRFWRRAANEYADQTRSLDVLMGDDAKLLIAGARGLPDLAARAAFADETFLAILAKSPRTPFDDRVDALFQVLIDPASATVDQMTETLGLPQSRLARLSKRGFGFPPKLLLRRQRFLRMLGTLHARPYEEWNDFIDPQYVDQSHMIRDFQRFLGVAPSHYFAMKRPILAAAAKARAAMFGQPLQGLHLPARKGLTS